MICTYEVRIFIKYKIHKNIKTAFVTTAVVLTAEQKDKISINIVNNNVTFNEDLSFTYDVPEGYEQLFID